MVISVFGLIWNDVLVNWVWVSRFPTHKFIMTLNIQLIILFDSFYPVELNYDINLFNKKCKFKIIT